MQDNLSSDISVNLLPINAYKLPLVLPDSTEPLTFPSIFPLDTITETSSPSCLAKRQASYSGYKLNQVVGARNIGDIPSDY